MVYATVEVKKWGNSLGLIVPKKTAHQIGLKPGEKIEIEIVKKQRADYFGICKGSKPFDRGGDEHTDIIG